MRKDNISINSYLCIIARKKSTDITVATMERTRPATANPRLVTDFCPTAEKMIPSAATRVPTTGTHKRQRLTMPNTKPATAIPLFGSGIGDTYTPPGKNGWAYLGGSIYPGPGKGYP